MAKLHKIELYIIDPNESYESAMDVFSEIDNKLYDGMPVTFKSNTVEVDWFDDIDINNINATREEFEHYFLGKM